MGFIVIKPLPQTFIGRTCLRTYDDDGGRRKFPIIRKYNAHFWGNLLEIETLAFQEQDTIVAACATSALWTAFQGTGVLFHHSIPTPNEITNFAQKDIPIDSRKFPSKGLTYNAMARAIQCVGLEPELQKNDSECIFKLSVYAYLLGKIPILLGADLYDSVHKKLMGKHAVTVTGFSLGAVPTPSSKYNLLLRSSKIDKIYAHDDQIGPFSRMVFHQNSVPTKYESKFSLNTTWRNLTGEIGGVWLAPDISLIPLYKKIRLPLTTILKEVQAFDKYIEYLRNIPEGQKVFKDRIEWEIFISDNSEFKLKIYREQMLSPKQRYEILTSSLPRFIWRAKAWFGEDPIIELIFDSTDIEQSNFLLRIIEYNRTCCEFIRSVLSSDPKKDYWKKQHTWRTLNLLAN